MVQDGEVRWKKRLIQAETLLMFQKFPAVFKEGTTEKDIVSVGGDLLEKECKNRVKDGEMVEWAC
jgi:hypothetical protein